MFPLCLLKDHHCLMVKPRFVQTKTKTTHTQSHSSLVKSPFWSLRNGN